MESTLQVETKREESLLGNSLRPKSNLVIACPGSVQARDPFADSATESVFTDKISSKVAFHPSGNKLAFGVADRLGKSASIKAREFKGDKSGWTVDFPSLVTDVKFSSDGSLVVASGYDQTIKVLESVAGTGH